MEYSRIKTITRDLGIWKFPEFGGGKIVGLCTVKKKHGLLLIDEFQSFWQYLVEKLLLKGYETLFWTL